MDALQISAARCCAMRLLRHIKTLDDALGHFLVQITCKCGARRIAEPEALTRLRGASATLETVGRRMRYSKCGKKGTEVVAVARPRPRGGGSVTIEFLAVVPDSALLIDPVIGSLVAGIVIAARARFFEP